MATWPSTLPRPTSDGYGVTPVNQTVSTDMEVGAPRMRRRTKARNDVVSVTWELTDAQMATFRAWFDSDSGAAGGAAYFYVDLVLGNGGIQNVSARFKDGFKMAHRGGFQFAVTAELMVR